MSCGCSQCKQLRTALAEKDRRIAELAAALEWSLLQWQGDMAEYGNFHDAHDLAPDPAAILAARDAERDKKVRAEAYRRAADLFDGLSPETETLVRQLHRWANEADRGGA